MVGNIFSFFSVGQEGKNCSELAKKFAAVEKSHIVLELSSTGNILSINDNFVLATGYSREAILGKHYSFLVQPQLGKGGDRDTLLSSMKCDENISGEWQWTDSGGDKLWVQGSFNPICDGNGSVCEILILVSDISSLKKHTIESDAKLTAIDASHTVVEFEFDGTITDANKNFLSLVGYSLADIKGKRFSMFAGGLDEANAMDAVFNDKLPKGEHQTLKHKCVNKFGDPLWLKVSYNPIIGVSGKPFRFVNYISDITEQQEQLLKSKDFANISNALKLCQANVMLADNNMTIIYMNNQVKRMLERREREIQTVLPGFKVDQLVGTNVDQFHKRPEHQRSMIAALSEPYVTDLSVSELTFGLTATPWYDLDGERIGTVVEWEDKTDRLAEEEKIASEAASNARVKQALDNVTANVMIADADANIIYVNSAASEMMQDAESDIRQSLPHFNADGLLGTNIDTFHKKPGHQRNILKDLKQTYFGKAEVGGRTFTVIANPVFQDGTRVGTVVEWADKTVELSIEREIDSIVEAVGSGDFTKQVSLEGKEGFSLKLARGLNNLTSTVEVALNDVLRMLGAMARGDLSERITREYGGSFGQLKNDANTTADKLTEVISKIRISSNAIATTATEIAQGNADLSQRTEEQASSLEETASSMEEMTSTVRQSADNASLANTLASEAQDKAREGGSVVEKAVLAMDDINVASKKISDIIGVIDEIAFQTNLLALNAAVEAARAGEQGRGFAVVAGEVRNLAQRSASAAKEIKDLIRDTVTKVQDGTELVNQSGNTLSEIVAAVENVTLTMKDIAEAAKEQTSGIEQVNTAVSQMDSMTQKNAALVEEATAASEAMADNARDMNRVVSFFGSAGAVDMQVPERQQAATVSAKAKPSEPVAQPYAPSADDSYLSTPDMSSDDEWEDF